MPARSLSPGDKFGRLTVVCYSHTNKHKNQVWLLRCACGGSATVTTAELRKSGTQSCGCLKRDTMAARNMATAIANNNSPELSGRSIADPDVRSLYDVWKAMRQRCNNPNDKEYANYGGRGVKVCERWDRSFAAFLSDMGTRPSSKHSIDRENNEKGYEPGNMRWANPAQQVRNRRITRRVEYQGQLRSTADLADENGLAQGTLNGRLTLHGWSIAKALTTPVRMTWTHDGLTLTPDEWAVRAGISLHTLKSRINLLDWPISKALTTPVRRMAPWREQRGHLRKQARRGATI
jgi:hypothetical protein